MRAPLFALASLVLLTASGCGSPTTHGFNPGDAAPTGDLAFLFAEDSGPNNGKDGGGDSGPMQVCNPNDPPACDGQTGVKICRADGSGYDTTACPNGSTCQNGACTCVVGALDCQGNDVVRCGMDGAFHPDHTCPKGTVCGNGTCADPRCADETISNNPHALPVAGWPRFRHDNRNSGTTPVAVAAMPKLKWKTFIGGTMLDSQKGLASGPVVNQSDEIFIGAGDLDNLGGSFYALDPTGKKLYTFAAQRGYGLSTPAVRADGTAYFSTTTSILFAVDPLGKQAWQYKTASQADSDPIVTKDGNLIYSSDDGSVYALDATGKLLWKSDPTTGPAEVDGGLAESCDGRIYAGGLNGWYTLDAMTGMVLWKVKATGARGALVSSPVLTADGRMFGFDSGGQGIGLDPAGKVLWQKQSGSAGAGSSPALAGGVLYVVLNDGALHAIDSLTGNEQWSKPVNTSPHLYLNAGPITDGHGRIYFNSNDGFVYAFDTTGAQQWKLPASGVAQKMDWAGTMAIGKDGTLYVPGTDGNLYAYQ